LDVLSERLADAAYVLLVYFPVLEGCYTILGECMSKSVERHEEDAIVLIYMTGLLPQIWSPSFISICPGACISFGTPWVSHLEEFLIGQAILG